MFQRTQSFHFRRGRDATTSTSTTARTQSFRFVRRGGRQNDVTTSAKSQATHRDFRRAKGIKKFRRKRLKYYMASLEKHWDDSEINKNSETGEYKIITLDDEYNHKFSLNVSQEDDVLSVTTCIYTCTSELQSTSVMKKALELNYFVGDRKGYLLAIDPSSSSSSVGPPPNSRSSQQHQHSQSHRTPCCIELQQFPIIKLSLCFSRPMSALGGNENFFDLMRNFTEVASNIQSQLEDADEGRFGMTPRTITDTANSIASLTSPPSIIAQLTGQTIDENAVLSPPLKNTATRISSCSKMKPRERSTEKFRKSFVKTSSMRSSQFLSPEEARVYELYATHKSKQRRINSSKKKKEDLAATAIAGCRSVSTDTKNDIKIVNSSTTPPPPPPRPPQRTMSLPIGEKFVIPSPPPPHPTAIDTLRQQGNNCFDGKTPVISNKRIKIADYTKNNSIATSMTTKPPPPKTKYSLTTFALLTTTQGGNHHHQPTPTPPSKGIDIIISSNSNSNSNNDKKGKLFRFEKMMTMTTMTKKGGNVDDDDDGNDYLHNSRKTVSERNLSTDAGKRSSLIPPQNGISNSTGDDDDKKDRESSRFQKKMMMKVKMGSIVNDGDDCSDDGDENSPQKSVSEPKLSTGRSNTRFLI